MSSGALGNEEYAGLGQRQELRGYVRRLSDNPALLRCATPCRIADHDQTAGDAEPHVEPFRSREPGDRIDHCEPGPHGPLGIIFVRFWITEIERYPIRHVLGDKAGELADRVCDAA